MRKAHPHIIANHKTTSHIVNVNVGLCRGLCFIIKQEIYQQSLTVYMSMAYHTSLMALNNKVTPGKNFDTTEHRHDTPK